MNRDRVQRWIARYVQAWRTPGSNPLKGLFADDATYQVAPFEPAIVGLDAIADMWEAERTGPDERFSMDFEVVAVDDDVAVARVAVRYEDPSPHEYRDLWIIRFAADGRCQSFEEWPFWPGQPRIAPGD